MSQSLTLGNFDLIDNSGDYDVETLAEGTEWGNPQPLEVVLASLLQDGSIVVTQGHDNRTVTIIVRISAADSAALAQGESDLFRELGKPSTLTWTPPDGWGAATVWDVVTSSLEHNMNDLGEVRVRVQRTYTIRLVCAPFGRSVNPTVVAAIGAPPVTPTTVQVDDCSSLTGWTGSPSAATVASGIIAEESPTTVTGYGSVWLSRTGSIDVSVTRYIQVDASIPTGSPVVLFATIDGVDAPLFAKSAAGAFTRFTFKLPDALGATVNVLKLTTFSNGSAYRPKLLVDQVQRTNQSPIVGTGRQQFRTVTVGGSARTQGSLHVTHDTSALGEVLVYTNAQDNSGYQPACRQYRSTGGTVTVDASTASGASTPLDTSGFPETYDIPARALPAGTYSIMVRVKATASVIAGVRWNAYTRVGTTNLGGGQTGSVLIGAGTAYALFEVGRVVLPPVAVPPGSAANVRLEVSSLQGLTIDDTYLFNTDIGAVSWVDCGIAASAAGGSSNRLWIDTPTLELPRPSYWVGTLEDRSDARHVIGSEIKSVGTHKFPPGDINVFTMCANALYAQASLAFWKRWHTHAAEDS